MEQLNRNNFFRWEGDPAVLLPSPLSNVVLFGVGAAGLSAAQIAALPQSTNPIGSWEFTFSPTDQRIYFAYDAGIADLQEIVSPNGFNTLAGYIKSIENLNINGTVLPYKVYMSNANTTQSNYELIFR